MVHFSHNSWPNTLARLELFAGASPQELRQIGSLLTGLSAAAGDVLITEGSAGLEFLIIAGGSATVTSGGRTLARLGAGDFVGEMALLERVPRSATVTADSPLTFYVSNTAEFATILDIAPTVRAKIVAASQDREAANRAAA